MECFTCADLAVLWLRAPQLCYLGSRTPESGGIIRVLKKLKDDMPADHADSLKADEDDRKTDHVPLVAATENEASLVAAVKTRHTKPPSEDRQEGRLPATDRLQCAETLGRQSE